MDSSEMLISVQGPDPRDGYSTPVWRLPMAPPSTEASSPFQCVTNPLPHSQDLMHVMERLWSGSQKHTRRFSFENPEWSDDEGYLLAAPSYQSSSRDEDATVVDDSTPTYSRCSQSTLCGNLCLNEDSDSIGLPSPSPLGSHYHETLPSNPSRDCPESSPAIRHFSPRHRKGSLAGLAISPPLSVRQDSAPLGNVSPVCASAIDGDRIRSWPIFIARRDAPKPPVLEEKSVWDDSDSEDGAEPSQSSRFRRRVSNPLRAFLCKGKEPRRKSA